MFYNYLFFVGTFIFCYILVNRNLFLSNIISNFGSSLNQRIFTSKTNYEYNKFALLRIFFGLILFYRSFYVVYFLLPSEYFTPIGFWAFGELAASFLIILGFLTQWAFLFLIFFMWHIGDFVVLTSTLANDIGAMLAFLLVLTNAGKFISLDHLILRRFPKLNNLLIYYEGAPSAEQIALTKFIALMSYWAVCVYSLAIHLNESAWLSGVAGPLLLSNNFMSREHLFFVNLFSSSQLATFLAKISLWLQIIWYPLILPFVMIGGIFKRYVIIWGWLFFALSLFVLQLSALAYFEIILWLALFWESLGLNKKVSVFYDDTCNLCDKTIRAIIFLDIFKVVKRCPLSENESTLLSYGVTRQQAWNDLYGIIENKRYIQHGYDFYVLISKNIVLLWPFVPLLLLGKYLGIGPIIYRFIANRRHKLFGICKLGIKDSINTKPVITNHSQLISAFTLHSTFLTLMYLYAVPAPYIGIKNKSNVASATAHFYGIAPIDVFNKNDLHMTENWFVIWNDNFNERIPLLDLDGSRLHLHKSDRVYFGHTVRYRRKYINSSECHFDQWQNNITYLSKVYLHLKHASNGIYTFTYDQMHQDIANYDLIAAKNKYVSNSIHNRCSYKYTVNYQK